MNREWFRRILASFEYTAHKYLDEKSGKRNWINLRPKKKERKEFSKIYNLLQSIHLINGHAFTLDSHFSHLFDIFSLNEVEEQIENMC